MGVPLSLWVEVVAKHPVKYRFQGLDGFHKSVVEAAKGDEQWCRRHYENEADYYYRDGWPEHCKENGLDEDDEKARCEWVNSQMECFEVTLDDDAEAPYLLAEHPPVEVFDHASAEGVGIDDVYYFCPGCRHQPVWREDRTLHNARYCGLCGAEPTRQRDEDFFASLDLQRLPMETFGDAREYLEALVRFGFVQPRQAPKRRERLGERIGDNLWLDDHGRCNRWLTGQVDGRWFTVHVANDQITAPPPAPPEAKAA